MLCGPQWTGLLALSLPCKLSELKSILYLSCYFQWQWVGAAGLQVFSPHSCVTGGGGSLRWRSLR